jgi:nucleoside 2-deoxyribosyltransferase
MNIYIISSVRDADDFIREKLEKYVSRLEKFGDNVHLPHRDTNQKEKGINICKQNFEAIKNADEIHIFYNKDSQGSHFDLGMAFALGKSIKVIENDIFDEHKSFPRMILEWENSKP